MRQVLVFHLAIRRAGQSDTFDGASADGKSFVTVCRRVTTPGGAAPERQPVAPFRSKKLRHLARVCMVCSISTARALGPKGTESVAPEREFWLGALRRFLESALLGLRQFCGSVCPEAHKRQNPSAAESVTGACGYSIDHYMQSPCPTARAVQG